MDLDISYWAEASMMAAVGPEIKKPEFTPDHVNTFSV